MCGQPLSGTYWITRPPDGEHESCRDWSRYPFPFDDDLRRLRGIARHLARGSRAVIRVGRWLASAQRRWPRDAGEVVTEQRKRASELKEVLSDLAERLR